MALIRCGSSAPSVTFKGIAGNINPAYNPGAKITGMTAGKTYALTVIALANNERFALTAGADSVLSTDGNNVSAAGTDGGITTIIFVSDGNDVTVSSSGGGPSAWNAYSIVEIG